MPKPTPAQVAAVEALAASLEVPNDGQWYQVAAYVKHDEGGTNPGIAAVMAMPVRTYREQRHIVDAINREQEPMPVPLDSDPF